MQPGAADGGRGPLQQPAVSRMVQVNLTTSARPIAAPTPGCSLNSASMAVVADGMRRSRPEPVREFQGRRAPARAPRRSRPNLDGSRPARIAMVLNGAFATPVRRLRASRPQRSASTARSSKALRRAAGPRSTPTGSPSRSRRRARRITGLDPSLGGLLTNVALDGTINISGTRLVSDDLRIRSDRLNATVVVVADLATRPVSRRHPGHGSTITRSRGSACSISTPSSTWSARRQRLRPQGPGRGQDPADRQSTARGTSWRQRRRLGATSTMNPAGVITLDTIRLNAPRLRITSGGGTYLARRPDQFPARPACPRAYGALGGHRDRHDDPAAGPAHRRQSRASASAFAT